MMEKKIYIRAHHGLCIQNYIGRGYDKLFTENMNHIINILKNNPTQEIIICSSTDVVCNYCPHNHYGVCESEEKAEEYDDKCLSLSGFSKGEHLSWDLFQNVLFEKIIKSSKLSYVCKDCCWVSLCEKVSKNKFF